MRRTIRSRPDNINSSNYHLTRTLGRMTGDVRPGGSRALDNCSCETINIKGCFAKSHEVLPAKPCLDVKTRLVIYAFREQFRALFLPFLERLNRRFVLERTLRNVVVVDLDVVAQGRFQFGG